MSDQKTEVVIGGKTYAITTPLKFKQLSRFEPAFIRYSGNLTESKNFDALAEALIHVLNEEYPEFTLQFVNDLRTTPIELMEAADALAYASGVYKKKAIVAEGAAAEDQSGEVKKA